MNPSMHQHLSLSKTVVLRAHQIDPFVQALKEAFSSSRRYVQALHEYFFNVSLQPVFYRHLLVPYIPAWVGRCHYLDCSSVRLGSRVRVTPAPRPSFSYSTKKSGRSCHRSQRHTFFLCIQIIECPILIQVRCNTDVLYKCYDKVTSPITASRAL